MGWVKGQRAPGSKQFSKDYQPERKGGRPPQIYSTIKRLGYGKDDIVACASEVLFMDLETLQSHIDNPRSPAILVMMCKATKSDMEAGEFNKITPILARLLPLQGASFNQQVNIGGGEDALQVSLELIEYGRAQANGPLPITDLVAVEYFEEEE